MTSSGKKTMRYSDGEYGQREQSDYLEEYFNNHIEDYVIQELETEHDIGEDPFNHTAEFLNGEKDQDDNYWGYLDDLICKIASSFNLDENDDLEAIEKIAAIKFNPHVESPLDDLKNKLDNINIELYKTYLKELKYQADDSFWNSENEDIWKEHLYSLQQSYYNTSNFVANFIADFLFHLKIDFEDHYSHSWNSGDFESRYISFRNKDGDELTIRLCDGHDNGSFYEDSENKEINLFDLLNREISLSDILDTVKDLLIDDFEEFPNFDISNKEKELEILINDFENID